MCKKKNEVQVVMTGHSISVATMSGHFLITWEINKKFERYRVLDWFRSMDVVPSDVSCYVFPWLKELRS